MADGFYQLDQALNRITGNMTAEEKLNHILAFLHRLTEALCYFRDQTSPKPDRFTVQGDALVMDLPDGSQYRFDNYGITYRTEDLEETLAYVS